ncbi:unnamed protein product [Cuscuta epithymum]|uniref:Uncharacterized protein n=1 Tax=Cuscuta epithymum TaxID=186058 RepID=A0AAV0CCQ9_9ASTE|nr:unnamed protein product [Cuscuta epithymum]
MGNLKHVTIVFVCLVAMPILWPLLVSASNASPTPIADTIYMPSMGPISKEEYIQECIDYEGIVLEGSGLDYIELCTEYANQLCATNNTNLYC